MSEPPSLRQTTRLSAWAGVRDWTLLLALATLGPYVAHLTPTWDDSPIGAHFIPAFYAPLLGVAWRRFGFAIGLALVSPWINYLLFGMPARHLALLLTFELLVYTVWLVALLRVFGRHAWLGPAAYLLMKPLAAGFLATTHLLPVLPLQYVAQSVINAIPGLLVLAVLGWWARPPASHA
jgi:hypothetical protein